MIIIEPIKEASNTINSLRETSLIKWEKELYNYIVDKMGPNILKKVLISINDKSNSMVPEGTDPEDIKQTIKLALIDFVDSSM